MSRVYKLIIIVFIVKITTVKCNYNSQCSEIVSYIRYPLRKELLAKINIPDPPKKFRQLTLKVLYEARGDFMDVSRIEKN